MIAAVDQQRGLAAPGKEGERESRTAGKSGGSLIYTTDSSMRQPRVISGGKERTPHHGRKIVWSELRLELGIGPIVPPVRKVPLYVVGPPITPASPSACLVAEVTNR